MGGKNTIVMHNTCEDSLLATRLIYDLVILGDLCKRVQMRKDDESEWESFHPVLSLLSYMLKAPLVPKGAPVVNALFTQRESWREFPLFCTSLSHPAHSTGCAVINFMRACLGLAPDNHMTLEHRFESSLADLSDEPVIKKMRLN